MQPIRSKDVAVLLQYGAESCCRGGAARAVEGITKLSEWTKRGMSVIAGGGVRPEDVALLTEAGVFAVCTRHGTTSQQGIRHYSMGQPTLSISTRLWSLLPRQEVNWTTTPIDCTMRTIVWVGVDGGPFWLDQDVEAFR